MSGSSQLDHAALVRRAAVQSLLATPTLALNRVEDHRLDNIPSGDMPRITISADEHMEGISQAGTEPKFEVKLSLLVEAFAERASRWDVVEDIDVLIAQIKNGLLSDPNWVQMSSAIDRIVVRRRFDTRGERYLGHGQVMMELSWRESYPPRIPDTLERIDIDVQFGVAPPAPPPPPAPVDVTISFNP